MRQVKFTGNETVLLPTLNLLARKGDVLTVPDDFDALDFEDVPTKTKADK